MDDGSSDRGGLRDELQLLDSLTRVHTLAHACADVNPGCRGNIPAATVTLTPIHSAHTLCQ